MSLHTALSGDTEGFILLVCIKPGQSERLKPPSSPAETDPLTDTLTAARGKHLDRGAETSLPVSFKWAD